MNNPEYDIIIAGGSFAGLYLATILPKRYKVCIIEKEPAITSFLNTTGSTLLEKGKDIFSLFDIPEDTIINQYDTFAFTSPRQHCSTKFSNPIWCLLDIGKVKQHLISSLGSNVTLIENSEIIDLEESNADDLYQGVKYKNHKNNDIIYVTAKVFVDSTGSSAILAMKANIQTPKHYSSYYQVDATIDESISAEDVNLYLGFDFCPGAYAYIFPLSKTKVRIGTGITTDYTKAEVTSSENLFSKFTSYKNFRLSNIENVVNTTVYTGGFINKNYCKNVISIGDSAGHVSPIWGEGIRFAFHGATIAKPLIERYLEGDTASFKQFKEQWQKKLGNSHLYGYFFQSVIGKRLDTKSDDFVKYLNKLKHQNPDLILRVLSTEFGIFDISSFILPFLV